MVLGCGTRYYLLQQKRSSGQPQNLHQKPPPTSSKFLLVSYFSSEPPHTPTTLFNLQPTTPLSTQLSHPLLPVFSFYR